MPGRGVLSAVMDEALELVAPTRCVGCDEPGALLCDECLAALPWVRQELACPNCGAPHGGLTCTECSEPWETRACVCALGFLGPVRRLVPAGHGGRHALRAGGGLRLARGGRPAPL